jgi:hypothetical protein
MQIELCCRTIVSFAFVVIFLRLVGLRKGRKLEGKGYGLDR